MAKLDSCNIHDIFFLNWSPLLPILVYCCMLYILLWIYQSVTVILSSLWKDYKCNCPYIVKSTSHNLLPSQVFDFYSCSGCLKQNNKAWDAFVYCIKVASTVFPIISYLFRPLKPNPPIATLKNKANCLIYLWCIIAISSWFLCINTRGKWPKSYHFIISLEYYVKWMLKRTISQVLRKGNKIWFLTQTSLSNLPLILIASVENQTHE